MRVLRHIAGFSNLALGPPQRTSESDMYSGNVLRKVPLKASRLWRPTEDVLLHTHSGLCQPDGLLLRRGREGWRVFMQPTIS